MAMKVMRKLKGREEPVRLIGVPVLVLPVTEEEGEEEVVVEETEFEVAEGPVEDMARRGQKERVSKHGYQEQTVVVVQKGGGRECVRRDYSRVCMRTVREDPTTSQSRQVLLLRRRRCAVSIVGSQQVLLVCRRTSRARRGLACRFPRGGW